MNAGDLRDRITIEVSSVGRDDAGGKLVDWAAQEQRWAAVENLTGAKLAYAQGFAAATTQRVRMRWLDNVTAERHRITYRGGVYAITGVVDPDNRRTELWVYATRVGS